MSMASRNGLTELQRQLAHAFLSRARGFFLTGGAVLVGWELAHRTTDDLDFFTDSNDAMAVSDATLRGAAESLGATVTSLVGSPDFHRYVVQRGDESVRVDVVRDRTPQLHDKLERDGIRMDSVEEIFVNKICALVGRSEIRDLVDLMALEERGLRVEDSLALAQRKDASATPATLGWLLSTLTIPEGPDRARLQRYAKDLERRMLALAVPSP